MSMFSSGNIQDSRYARLQSSGPSSHIQSNLIGLIGAICAILIFLAPLPDYWNIRLPFYLVIFVWAVLRPRIALYLTPFAVPWGSLDTITLAGLNLTSSDILVGLLLLGWFLSFGLPQYASSSGPQDREAHAVPRYLIVAILLLLGTMLLSIVAATRLSSSLKEISKWVEFLILIAIGAQYLRTRRQIWTLIILICLAGISQAFMGYIQDYFNLGPDAFVRDASLRVYGTFGQPNPYAGYINIALSIAIALFLLGSNWGTRLMAFAAVVLLGGAELLTNSRGGQMGLAVAVLFIVFVGIPRLRILGNLAGIGALCILGTVLAGFVPVSAFQPVLEKLGLVAISFTAPSPADFSTAERLAHWYAGIQMFLNHPYIGVGIGNYPDVYQHYYLTIFVNSLGHAHNYYINIAAETGIIGFIAYMIFLTTLFVAGTCAYRAIARKYLQAKNEIQPVRKNIAPFFINRILLRLSIRPFTIIEYNTFDPAYKAAIMLADDKALAIGLLAALISVCVHNFVDNLYVHSVTNLIALLLIALIRLPGVTASVNGTEGHLDLQYRKR